MNIGALIILFLFPVLVYSSGFYLLNVTYAQTNVSAVPDQRSFAAIGVSPINNEMLLLGGRLIQPSILFDNQVFRFTNNTWVPLSSKVDLHKAETCSYQQPNNDILYVYGGIVSDGSKISYSQDLAIINVTSYGVTKVNPTIPSNLPSIGMSCSLIKGDFYVFGGGATTGSCSNDLWLYSVKQNEWMPVNVTGSKPPALQGASMVATNESLIIFGGSCGVSFSNETWIFSFENETWVQEKSNNSGPISRYNHAAAIDFTKSTNMLIYGGQNYLSQALDDVWTYDFNNKTWSKEFINSTLPTARWGAATLYTQGRLLIYGGRNSTASFNDLWQLVPEGWCEGLNCTQCTLSVGCGWCAGKCFSGNLHQGSYLPGRCKASDFSKDVVISCGPSPWAFSVWWIVLALSCLATCSGTFIFIGKTVCFKDPEEYSSIQ